MASVGLLIELFRSLVVCKNGRGRGSVHQVDNVNVDMQRGRGSFHQVDNVNVDMQRGRSSFHQVDNVMSY